MFHKILSPKIIWSKENWWVEKQMRSKNIFGVKKFWVRKTLGSKDFCIPKIFNSKKFLVQKKGLPNLWGWKILGKKLGQKYICSILVQITLGLKKFGCNKILVKIILAPKKVDPKSLAKLWSGTEDILLVCTNVPRTNVPWKNVTLTYGIWQIWPLKATINVWSKLFQ